MPDPQELYTALADLEEPYKDTEDLGGYPLDFPTHTAQIYINELMKDKVLNGHGLTAAHILRQIEKVRQQRGHAEPYVRLYGILLEYLKNDCESGKMNQDQIDFYQKCIQQLARLQPRSGANKKRKRKRKRTKKKKRKKNKLKRPRSRSFRRKRNTATTTRH